LDEVLVWTPVDEEIGPDDVSGGVVRLVLEEDVVESLSPSWKDNMKHDLGFREMPTQNQSEMNTPHLAN
jgi:hypothetical protein